MNDMALRGPVLDPSNATAAGLRTPEEASCKSLAEEHIRTRAHELWERAGSPEGREDEFWHRAEKELQETEELREIPRAAASQIAGIITPDGQMFLIVPGNPHAILIATAAFAIQL